jgi:hypothetical protein
MTKEIFFKDTIPTETTIGIFGKKLCDRKREDDESGLSERIRAKYRIWWIIFSYLDRAVNRKEHYVGFMIHPIFQPRFMSLLS